jgi:hypothetical protein
VLKFDEDCKRVGSLWRVAVGVCCKLYANSIFTGIKLDAGPVEAVFIFTSLYAV